MDKVLKQRLVGAAIIIALAVIFLPMLFDSGEEPRSQRQLTLDLPERPTDSQREVRRLPLDPDQPRRMPDESAAEPPEELTTPPAGPARRQTEQAGESEPVADPVLPDTGDQPQPDIDIQPLKEGEAETGIESEQVAEAETGPDVETEPAPASEDSVPPATEGGDWLVQVAVFSNEATADSVYSRLEQLGHRVMRDHLVRDQSELHRLRTGPYSSREQADTARGQIAATVAGVQPVVRETAGDTTDSAPARAGYAVQVGSFASRNNAERLVARLNGQGYDSFMHEDISGGREIWRVRVGTFDQREPADELLDELRENFRLEGIVVTHP